MLLVLAACIVEAVVINPYQQYRVLKAAFVTLLYCSNLYFAHINLNYFFRETAANPLLHTWSLAVEEQFYLVWPIFLLILAKTRSRAKIVPLAFIALATVSFAFCIWYTSDNLQAAFFDSLARVWEFCLGGLVTLLSAACIRRIRGISSWLGVYGFIVLLVCAQWMCPSMFPGFVAIFPALGSMAILLAGASAPSSLVPRLLSTRPAQLIGGLSYSLYLWHWPALIVAQQLFPSGSLAVRLAAIVVAVALATVTHRLVENPIRFHPFLAVRPGLTLRLAFYGACIFVAALGAWRYLLVQSAQFQKFDRFASDSPALYENGCVSELRDPRPRLCSFGDAREARATVVLFGDSHAAEWFPALEKISVEQRWRLLTLVKPGCTPFSIEEDISPLMERVCAEWRRNSIEQIQALRPNLVVVACVSLHGGENDRMVTDVSIWQQAAHGTFIALSQPGTQIRFLRDTPHSPYNVLECLAQAEWSSHTHCPVIDPDSALYPEIYLAVQRSATGLANIGFVNLSDQMCSARQCYTEIGGVIVYRDRDHLTATYNRSLAQVLAQRLIASLSQ